ncbi:MAG: hypothetical protein ACKO7W_04905 [Elainella sp.]
MPESIKDQLTADLQKVKSVGGDRIDRIRKIFQEALTQTVSELKEGGTEVQSIAKESNLAELLKKPAASEAAPEVKPVTVTIEDMDAVNLDTNSAASSEVTDAGSTDKTVVNEIITDETIVEALLESASPTHQSKPQIAIVDAPVGGTTPVVNPISTAAPDLTDTEPAATEQPDPGSANPLPASVQAILDRITAFWNDEQTQAQVKPVVTKLNQLLAFADRKLAGHYGERYDAFKQEFREDMQETKVWYNKVKAKAVETGEFWLDRKQTDFEVKAGEAGATIAQKEQKIKQLLKELWQTVTKG